MNMACVSSQRCLGSLVVRKKEFQLKRFISLEEINLSRQKQNYRFYLFDKSWNFSIKPVILLLNVNSSPPKPLDIAASNFAAA